MLERIGFIPEIIIICWVSRFISPGFLETLYIKSKAKIIAYPMDMSIFTGGCHYSWNCDGYKFECSNCPAVISLNHKNLASKVLNSKKLAYSTLNFTIIPA